MKRDPSRPLVPGFRDKTVRRVQEETSRLARNEGVERGEPVTVAEISGYALPGILCKKCRGKGVVHPKGAEVGRACVCSTRRFLRAHPEVIVDEAGLVWWPKRRPELSGGG